MKSAPRMSDKRLHARILFTRVALVALALFTLMTVGAGLITGIRYLKELMYGLVFFPVLFGLLAASNHVSGKINAVAAKGSQRKCQAADATSNESSMHQADSP